MFGWFKPKLKKKPPYMLPDKLILAHDSVGSLLQHRADLSKAFLTTRDFVRELEVLDTSHKVVTVVTADDGMAIEVCIRDVANRHAHLPSFALPEDVLKYTRETQKERLVCVEGCSLDKVLVALRAGLAFLRERGVEA